MRYGLCFAHSQRLLLALPCRVRTDGWCQVSCMGLHFQTLGHHCSSALNLLRHFGERVSMDLG